VNLEIVKINSRIYELTRETADSYCIRDTWSRIEYTAMELIIAQDLLLD